MGGEGEGLDEGEGVGALNVVLHSFLNIFRRYSFSAVALGLEISQDFVCRYSMVRLLPATQSPCVYGANTTLP